jgi:hypothetical protein
METMGVPYYFVDIPEGKWGISSNKHATTCGKA